MFTSIFYEPATGKIRQRNACSDRKQLSLQEPPPDCIVIEDDFSDPNRCKIVGSGDYALAVDLTAEEISAEQERIKSLKAAERKAMTSETETIAIPQKEWQAFAARIGALEAIINQP